MSFSRTSLIRPLKRYYAVGLRLPRFEAVLYILFGAALIEKMLACGFALSGSAEPIGEFFSVIRQDFIDPERGFCNQTVKESTGVCGAFVVHDFQIHPAGRSINRY